MLQWQRWSRGHKARGQGQGHEQKSRPRTAFPRTDTLEAKDLIFEAKAKDFKMCPRGQGRPQGLHLSTMASTTGRWSGGRSPLCWLEMWMCRRQRKGRGMM